MADERRRRGKCTGEERTSAFAVTEPSPTMWMMEASKQRQLWILRASTNTDTNKKGTSNHVSPEGSGSGAGGVCSCHPSTLSQTSYQPFVSFPYPFVLFSGLIFPVEWGADQRGIRHVI